MFYDQGCFNQEKGNKLVTTQTKVNLKRMIALPLLIAQTTLEVLRKFLHKL